MKNVHVKVKADRMKLFLLALTSTLDWHFVSMTASHWRVIGRMRLPPSVHSTLIAGHVVLLGPSQWCWEYISCLFVRSDCWLPSHLIVKSQPGVAQRVAACLFSLTLEMAGILNVGLISVKTFSYRTAVACLPKCFCGRYGPAWVLNGVINILFLSMQF